MSQKKKIAVCIPQVPFVIGGAEIYAATLVKELGKRGYEADQIKIPFKWYPHDQLIKEALIWRLLDLEESNGAKIDLVIGTKFPSYGIQHHNKVTWLVHQHRAAYDLYGTDFSEFGPNSPIETEHVREWIKKYDEIGIKESKLIYSLSKNVQKRLLKYNGIPSEALYHPPSLHGRYRFGNYEPYILSVGRLEVLKRNELLIKSLALTDKNLRCIIVGKGPELKNLQKLSKDIGVADRVDFLGYVTDDELIQLYSNAGLVFYAPYDEDYGYVTLEAYFSAKPVITCNDSGGTLEFVKNDQTGFVTDSKPESVAENIMKAFNNPFHAREMGQEGYKMVSPINWDNVIDKLTETLRS